MGLDMYLDARMYFFKQMFDENLKTDVFNMAFIRTMKKLGLETQGLDEVDLSGITFKVGYWRKANAIHNWFVKNVQDGQDDCREYDVSRKQLKQLKKDCKKALSAENPDEVMPTTNGTFFGEQGYNDYYYSELKETIKIVDTALKLPDSVYFLYRSSW